MISAQELQQRKNPCRLENMQSLERELKAAQSQGKTSITTLTTVDPQLQQLLSALGYSTQQHNLPGQVTSTTIYWD